MGKARSVSSFENEFTRRQKELSAFNNLLADNLAGPFQNFPEAPGAIPKALLIEGGMMKGPLAFKDSIIGIVSGAVDIGRTTSGFSSFVVIQAESGTTDDLTDINNWAFPGQTVFIQADTGDTITIKTSGNIDTADGADFTLNSNLVTQFIYTVKSASWVQTAGAGEVATWTQIHDADGFNLLLDQDGDTKLMNDRDGDIADDQVGITVTGTFADFKFAAAGFQVIDQVGHSEALTISKTGTQATLNSTDIIALEISSVDKLTINKTSGAVVIHDYTLNLLDVSSGEALTINKDSAEALFNSTDAYAFQIAGTDRINVNNLADGNFILTDLTLNLLESVSGESGTIDKSSFELLYNSTDKHTFAIGGTDQVEINNGAFIPRTDSDIDLGTSSLAFKELFVDKISFADGEISEASNDLDVIGSSGNKVNLSIAGTGDFLTCNDGSSPKRVVIHQQLEIGPSLQIKSTLDGFPIGILVTNDTLTLGSAGSMQAPTLNESVPATTAAIDTDFGDVTGCYGFYVNTTLNTSVFVVRQSDGSWSGVSLTHNLVTG